MMRISVGAILAFFGVLPEPKMPRVANNRRARRARGERRERRWETVGHDRRPSITPKMLRAFHVHQVHAKRAQKAGLIQAKREARAARIQARALARGAA